MRWDDAEHREQIFDRFFRAFNERFEQATAKFMVLTGYFTNKLLRAGTLLAIYCLGRITFPERPGIALGMSGLVAFMPQVPEGVVDMLGQISDTSVLAYTIASNVRMDMERAQDILTGGDTAAQIRTLLGVMQHELEVLELGQQIRDQAQSEMEKVQREYFLREQLKAIQRELGEGGEQTAEVDELRGLVAARVGAEEQERSGLRERTAPSFALPFTPAPTPPAVVWAVEASVFPVTLTMT